jgi:hypothetical protein
MDVTIRRRVISVLVLLLLLVVASTPLVVLAAQQKDGTKNCGSTIGYVHSYYNDAVSHYGPGGTMGYSFDNDGLWHHRERNGSYSGHWYSLGDPYLNGPGTYAGCRNYG